MVEAVNIGVVPVLQGRAGGLVCGPGLCQPSVPLLTCLLCRGPCRSPPTPDLAEYFL